MASSVRRWATGVGLAGGAAVAATMIGTAGPPIARADVGDADAASAATDLATSASSASNTPGDVLDQAINDLNQGTSVLDTASTVDLSAYQANVLSIQEALAPTNLDPTLTELASLKDTLPAADQTSLADVDEQLVSAAQSVLSADQAFVAGDQAGDLSSSFLPVDWTVISADLGFLGADLNAGGATLLDILTSGLDTSSAADLASSLDPASAVDPSIFADMLSSIGL